MDTLLIIARTIDRLNEWIARIACWAIFVAIVISAGNAIVRKVFGTSSNAWLELQWYLFGVVFMFCAPWTLKLNEHIRIEVVAEKFSRKVGDIIEVACTVLFLLVFSALMVGLCIPFVWDAIKSAETSANVGGLPLWPARLVILVGFGLMFLQGASQLVKRIAVMTGHLVEAAAEDAHETEAQRILNELKDVNPRIADGSLKS